VPIDLLDDHVTVEYLFDQAIARVGAEIKRRVGFFGKLFFAEAETAMAAGAADAANGIGEAAARSNLTATLGSRVTQLAGFSEKGVPLILDENVMARGLSEGLRAQGYNVRTVTEIFGRTGVADADIINVARSVGGRVITNNVRDFGRALAIPLPRTSGWTPSGVAQFIEYYRK
jgi:predicted nucleic acid-binding protein